MTGALQVRFQLEQGREGLQRQLAASDGHMHILQAKLEDSQAEQTVGIPCSRASYLQALMQTCSHGLPAVPLLFSQAKHCFLCACA